MYEYSSYRDHEEHRIRRLQQRLDAVRREYLALCDEATRILHDRYGVRRVYVFGSLLKPEFGSGSDVDLAVEGLNSADYFQALSDLSGVFGFQPDLVRLEHADPVLKARILEEGRIIDGSR